ncbi:thiaminase-2 [Anaerotignum neopropionicum]|uniref:Aminopyrimidine aminohydrolase n=1 Tax=Anaerotignum neopropionicum TaxID=36847 RepID=A0A136WI61_9FIRM|nr:thiaminase II [Anaerotignum neopropionicum]KXL54070.1 thiaminase-2 [Anaerotignum neopropionicum]
MKLTDRLYEEVKDIWKGYLTQTFVKELGEGTLGEDRFRFYMVQDYCYLLQYAKVFALGIVKAEEEPLMRRFASMVHDTLDGEMDVHKIYMKRLGITNEEIASAKIALANQSYTSYMLDIAYKGDILDVLVAVLSCAWSYQMIGEHLRTIPGALEHPLYGEWVSGYSSEAYIQSVKDIMDAVDEIGADISPKKEVYIKEIMRKCSLYERDFWEMAYHMDMGD